MTREYVVECILTFLLFILVKVKMSYKCTVLYFVFYYN